MGIYPALFVLAALAVVVALLPPVRRTRRGTFAALAVAAAAVLASVLVDVDHWGEHQPWTGLTLAVSAVGGVVAAWTRKSAA